MEILSLIIILVVGSFAGFFYHDMAAKKKRTDLKSIEHKIREDAERHKKDVILEARSEAMKIKDGALKIQNDAKLEEIEQRKKLEKVEARLLTKEENLETRIQSVEKGREDLEKKHKELETKNNEIVAIKKDEEEKLVAISKLSKKEAAEMLLKKTEVEIRGDLVKRIQNVEMEVKEEADKKARNYIVAAIQRNASEVTTENTITTVAIPSDDMKGRIIGREGRNINAFEKFSGVDVIVDDTPETIIISGFDLVRRYIAKLALESLIEDGRIHPSRIEEAIQKAQAKVAKLMKEFGEKAVMEAGVTGIHPDLIKLLGRLRFRTSYGQNILKHSVECSFIAANIAAETGADVNIARLGALFHDIGKAVDHEIEGSHATIGRDIAKKYGLQEEVVHCIEAHHEDVPMKTPEAMIVQASDAISGARPGARRESMDTYLKRLQELEGVATAFEGVDKAFAIQAGREIRVMVKPEEIDDLAAAKLANQIAREIEGQLTYPGQIKVNVLREKRAVDYAK